MFDVTKLRQDLISGKIDLDDMPEATKQKLMAAYSELMSIKVLTREEFDRLTDLIMIFLDYYTYSGDGEVIITDHEYDLLMNHYIENGGSLISRADIIHSKSRWDFVKHESPGMVGSIRKIYSMEELYAFWSKLSGARSRIRSFRVAPKFDGISSAIKVSSDGKILLAVTRNDGVQGQDITKVVQASDNGKDLAKYYGSRIHSGQHIWVKTELVMTTDNFNKLVEEKKYANRRSATSGIVNSPKNLEYAKYITVIPLAAHYTATDEIEYAPLDSKVITVDSPRQLMDSIEVMLSTIRDAGYPIRTDGVVVYPLGDDILPNYDDIMDNAVAYKVNTEEALTTIDYGYVSVGRLGNAIPMLHVIPVEVNETIVTDVSLGSFDKFIGMDLHEGEQVLIYSAGNVIPQAKVPDHRQYKASAKPLKIKKRCPYCNEKLTRYKATYRCENPDCIRVKSGRIANFVIKLKAENVSDKTIEDLVSVGLIEDIPDIFTVRAEEIETIPGYGADSAAMIVDEFEKIQTRPTPVSTLLGALGIQGISEKKCKKMVSQISDFGKMMKMSSSHLEWELSNADNIGFKTASIFAEFLSENKDLVNKLMDEMNVVNDIQYKGNVVFTGFRDPDLEKKFNDIGYEISGNVNGSTVAVIDSSYEHDSTKCKAAKRKGIDIVHVSEADKVLKGLKGSSY
jgi:DNA ligase (NAD+)